MTGPRRTPDRQPERRQPPAPTTGRRTSTAAGTRAPAAAAVIAETPDALPTAFAASARATIEHTLDQLRRPGGRVVADRDRDGRPRTVATTADGTVVVHRTSSAGDAVATIDGPAGPRLDLRLANVSATGPHPLSTRARHLRRPPTGNRRADATRARRDMRTMLKAALDAVDAVDAGRRDRHLRDDALRAVRTRLAAVAVLLATGPDAPDPTAGVQVHAPTPWTPLAALGLRRGAVADLLGPAEAERLGRDLPRTIDVARQDATTLSMRPVEIDHRTGDGPDDPAGILRLLASLPPAEPDPAP